MSQRKPLIIAIAAVSGGGKTTVTNYLLQSLPHSKALFFDDYNLEGPVNICDWVESGADCNEWKLAPLINDLSSLLNSSDDSVINDLHGYLLRGRNAYLNMLNTVKPNSDLVIDGTLPTDEIVNKLVKKINNYCKGSQEVKSSV